MGFALSSTPATRVCHVPRTKSKAMAKLHARLRQSIQDEFARQVERQRLREEASAQRRQAREKQDKERAKLEKLREQGKLKCKACKRKLLDFTVTADWGSREYHKACWRRLD